MSPTVLKSFLAPLAGALIGLLLPIGTTHAQDKIDFFVECDGGLLDAAGVIGPKHDYEINGECTLWRMVQPEDTEEMQALVDAGVTWRHDKALVKFKTRGRASWDRESAAVKESLTFEGPVTGKSTAQGTCVKDPFLAAVPCSGISRQTSLDAGPHLMRVLTFFASTKHFSFGNRFTVDEAQATLGPPRQDERASAAGTEESSGRRPRSHQVHRDRKGGAHRPPDAARRPADHGQPVARAGDTPPYRARGSAAGANPA